MRTTLKIVSVLVASISTAYAQAPAQGLTVTAPGVTVTAPSATPAAPAVVAAPAVQPQAIPPVQAESSSQPNFVYQDNEPSLREAIRKQGLIVMKKMDADLNKVEQEAAAAKGGSVPAGGMAASNGQSANNGIVELLKVQAQIKKQKDDEATEIARQRAVTLLSVYGMEGKMFAEVRIGGASGPRMTVREGEKLPTGDVVKKIKTDSILVGGKTVMVSSAAAQEAYAEYSRVKPQGNEGQSMFGPMMFSTNPAPITRTGQPQQNEGRTLLPPTALPYINTLPN